LTRCHHSDNPPGITIQKTRTYHSYAVPPLPTSSSSTTTLNFDTLPYSAAPNLTNLTIHIPDIPPDRTESELLVSLFGHITLSVREKIEMLTIWTRPRVRQKKAEEVERALEKALDSEDGKRKRLKEERDRALVANKYASIART